LLLPLRDEGLQLLTQEERGMLLNGIAGCYSTMGMPAQAFAYMYQALRESTLARRHGFDVVLYCNLSHELLMLGDCEEGLIYAQEGIERCVHLNNPRLLGTLLLNHLNCLTDLNRADEALADVHRLLAMPANVDGRGTNRPAFETMALAALRAGDLPFGEELITRARASVTTDWHDEERLDLTIAESEWSRLRGNAAQAVEQLELAQPLATERLGLRVRCQYYQALADAHERNANAAQALHYLRAWQALHLEQSLMASQARHQAASLRTELMRLQRQRDEIEARRRSTEKAHNELEATNLQLAQKIQQVQSLQETLREQAVRDGLTGLFNRRYLGDVLPGMLALARRDERPLSVAIIDLDWFKAVNDQHGHLVGDAVLKSFALLLLKHLRKSDVVCRFGGEEFCVLMPRTTAAQGKRKIEALLKQWRAMRLDIDGHQLGQHTFSAGVADSVSVAFPVETEAAILADDLLKRADDGALQAKRAGRGRVLLHRLGAVTETV
jgi:diguanylate cyclase (GGDEF)-like protein